MKKFLVLFSRRTPSFRLHAPLSRTLDAAVPAGQPASVRTRIFGLPQSPPPEPCARDIAVGVDTGGTFTDFVCRIPGQPERQLKVASTPDDPARSIVEGLRQLGERWGLEPRRIARFVHGTTVGTNAVLEGKGARIGLLATEGFGDVIEIGRQLRDPMYQVRIVSTAPRFLLPGARRREIPERVDAQGGVLRALDTAAVRRATDALVADGVECIAVCYLFSFLNPAHELATREIIRAAHPGLGISLSCEVDPGFREYERTVVTAFDAYIKPVVSRYLERLEARLRAQGVMAPLQLMQSRGGVAAGAIARQSPVRLFLSGPAGGVIGGQMEGALAGEANLITIDIGGTSSDIALIADGQPLTVAEGQIGRWPVRVPMVGVHALGAGGGSIARLDAAGGLRVGPDSAGSDPGPACYGRGGELATVTDASVVLGYLNPDYFAGGQFALDAGLAHAVIARTIADPLGLAPGQAALGIHRVLNATMAEGIRLVSIKRGYDPRQFTLVPLGGAGAVHATALAAELGIRRVLVPRAPGVLSAAGLLAAPVEHLASATHRVKLAEASMPAIRATLAELDAQVGALMAQEGLQEAPIETSYAAELCYIGQSHFLEVAFDPDGSDVPATLYRDFVAAHTRIYGHSTEAPAMIGSLRSTQRVSRALPPEAPATSAGGVPSAKARRAVLFNGATSAIDCPIHDRAGLPAGAVLHGPAIIEQPDTTTVLPAGWAATVHRNGGLLLTSDQ